MVIAKRIRELRAEKGLSLDELAAEAGLRTGVVSELERGEQIPTFEVLESLAQALAVPLFRLFCGDEPPRTPHLTDRVTLRELAEEHRQPSSYRQQRF